MKLWAGILLMLAAHCAIAQNGPNDAATKEDIDRYMAVVHSRDMMEQVMSSMSKPMHKMVHDLYVKDKDKLPPDFEEKEVRILDDMYKNMPFDEMLHAMEPVYQRHFTKGDVDALIGFYSSPTGQKMLRELPAIMSEVMEQTTPLLEKYAEKMQERIQDEFTRALKDPEKKSN